MNLKEARTLFVYHPPVWWLPSIAIVKAALREKWTLILWLHSDCVPQWPEATFTWWLQLRLWWPPIVFYRGWLKWEGS